MLLLLLGEALRVLLLLFGVTDLVVVELLMGVVDRVFLLDLVGLAVRVFLEVLGSILPTVVPARFVMALEDLLIPYELLFLIDRVLLEFLGIEYLLLLRL